MSAQSKQLWVALVGLAFGAFMLHYKLHPPHESLTDFWATFFCSIDLVLVSILFLSKSTAAWALLLNSFIAFLGIIMMTDLMIFSQYAGWIKISPWQQPFQWLMESMFPDIAILVADFMVGLALYHSIMTQPRKAKA